MHTFIFILKLVGIVAGILVVASLIVRSPIGRRIFFIDWR